MAGGRAAGCLIGTPSHPAAGQPAAPSALPAAGHLAATALASSSLGRLRRLALKQLLVLRCPRQLALPHVVQRREAIPACPRVGAGVEQRLRDLQGVRPHDGPVQHRPAVERRRPVVHVGAGLHEAADCLRPVLRRDVQVGRVVERVVQPRLLLLQAAEQRHDARLVIRIYRPPDAARRRHPGECAVTGKHPHAHKLVVHAPNMVLLKGELPRALLAVGEPGLLRQVALVRDGLPLEEVHSQVVPAEGLSAQTYHVAQAGVAALDHQVAQAHAVGTTSAESRCQHHQQLDGDGLHAILR
mmetsp:Transcript_62892/g.198627  ORF Transcript_62892/g.198627 Transcript_62892/m.198627 type:complete len:299 (+) Transcript_62892:482-1378(+)